MWMAVFSGKEWRRKRLAFKNKIDTIAKRRRIHYNPKTIVHTIEALDSARPVQIVSVATLNPYANPARKLSLNIATNLQRHNGRTPRCGQQKRPVGEQRIILHIGRAQAEFDGKPYFPTLRIMDDVPVANIGKACRSTGINRLGQVEGGLLIDQAQLTGTPTPQPMVAQCYLSLVRPPGIAHTPPPHCQCFSIGKRKTGLKMQLYSRKYARRVQSSAAGLRNKIKINSEEKYYGTRFVIHDLA